jgi:hypothetical protein
MTNEIIKNEMPPNYDELRKSVNRASNWRLRLEAIEELGQWKHKRTIDVLLHRMNNDAVYKVVEAAHQNLVKFGEDVQLPPRNRFELIKDANKVFFRIKKSLPVGHTYEEYKEKLKNMRLDLYDTYEGDKGDEFDAWLENVWATASKK